jgi:hypothetical protein
MQVDPQVVESWEEEKKKYPGQLELEIRSGTMSLIDISATKELLDGSYQFLGVSAITDTIYVYAENRIRVRVEQSYTDNSTTTTEIVKKRLRVWNKFGQTDYGLSLNLSAEIPYKGSLPNTEGEVEVKTRYSYQFDKNLRIDLTFGERGGNVEGEINAEKLTTKIISDALRTMFQFTYRSNLVYSKEVRIRILEEVRRLLGLPPTEKQTEIPSIPNGVLTQARNLRLQDLVGGGLIPRNPLGTEEFSWIVNAKANGTRQLVYFSELGLFTIQLPRTLSLISTGKAYIWPPALNGVLLEAELIPFSERQPPANDVDDNGDPRYNTYLVASDVLAYPGEVQWRQKTLINRLAQLRYILQQLPEGDLPGKICKIIGKEYIGINSARSWYDAMRHFLGPRRNQHPYTEDGLVFTPNGPYLTPDPPPLSSRNASTWREVIKWKNGRLNTFDLMFSFPPTAEAGSLYAWEINPQLEGGGSLIPFHPNEIIPEKIRDTQGHEVEWVEGQIYELSWTGSQVEMYRMRTNKASPNNIDVAEDAWKLAHDPIKEETLLGKDLTLMRREHNRQKLRLFDSLPAFKTGVHLDLASGNGGDLKKMTRFAKILMVEPVEKNMNELLKRRDTFKMTSQVSTLQTYAEDTNAIRAKLSEMGVSQVNSISMMFALTFFYDKPEHLDALVGTLSLVKEGGSIIMTTMDGMLVDVALNQKHIEIVNGTPILAPQPSDGTSPRAAVFEHSELKLVVSPPFNTPVFGRQVEINLPGTKLATTQIEYLVFLSELNKRLAPLNITQDEVFLLDSQPFLSDDEKTLSGMYVGIRWTRHAPPPLTLLPRLKPSTIENIVIRGENAIRAGVHGSDVKSGIASILQGMTTGYPVRPEGKAYLEDPKTIDRLAKESKAKTIEEFARWIRVPIFVFGSNEEKPTGTDGNVILVMKVMGGYEPVGVLRLSPTNEPVWQWALPPNDPLLA